MNARRLTLAGLVPLCALVGGLVFASAPALAAAPEISEEQVTAVEATAATLQAHIDPGGSETTYRFEYDTTPYTSSASHGTSVTKEGVGRESGIGLGTASVSVEVRVKSLQPGTVYYYRVVATSENGTLDGPDKTLTTFPALGSAPAQNCSNEQRRAEQPFGLELPDCRAYETVSPLNTEGNDATDPGLTASLSRAAVSGDAVTYASFGNFADPTGGTFTNQFLSRRGSDGWSTQAITPLHHAIELEATQRSSYEAMVFTPELTEGIAITPASLTGEAPEGELDYGMYVVDLSDDSYQYVTYQGESRRFNPLGASTDLSHVVFENLVPGSASELLEWVDGRVVPVGVTNNGNYMVDSTVGPRAVSAGGSHVYFASDNDEGVYLRENAEQPQSPMKVVNGEEECEVAADACTVEVSASQGGVIDPHGPQPAQYRGTSMDGSRVFFTSSAELTGGAYTGPADNAANLYEYDLERPVGERLKDLTVDKTDADGAAVTSVVQVSEDGSYVYFLAKGALATGATAGESNLYVSHDDGTPTLIAILSANDTAQDPTAVTPEGSRLAFVSERSLTGYDNEQAEPGECENNIGEAGFRETGKCREVYLYDAEAGGMEGLVCASCNPSGARPVGSSGFTPTEVNRNLAEDGRLFFESRDALVPHASDGRKNVYEYENGHVYPISDVAGGYESFFLAATPDGNDVFFGSADQLLPQDASNNVVVYDASVNGGFPAIATTPPCDNGDSCKPPPARQPGVFGAPGSSTFSGQGNMKPVVTVTPVVKSKAKSVKCKKGVRHECKKKPKTKHKSARKAARRKSRRS
ncbi:MAG: hypothetical protein ABSH36_12570 [Solirubrobacteraceae bacterium]